MPDIKAEVSDFSNLNQFNRKLLQLSDLRKPITSDIVSIKVYDGELITDKVIFQIMIHSIILNLIWIEIYSRLFI